MTLSAILPEPILRTLRPLAEPKLGRKRKPAKKLKRRIGHAAGRLLRRPWTNRFNEYDAGAACRHADFDQVRWSFPARLVLFEVMECSDA